MDYNKDAFPSQGAQLGPLEEVQEVRPSRFASTVGQGPARARVRGRDARYQLASPSNSGWIPYSSICRGRSQQSVAGLPEIKERRHQLLFWVTAPALSCCRGRLIELELQGLTVTHAHNLALGNRSLDTIQPGNQKPSEDEHQSSRSLESLIGQYRYLNTGTSLDPRWYALLRKPS